jgi:hypothetical protein
VAEVSVLPPAVLVLIVILKEPLAVVNPDWDPGVLEALYEAAFSEPGAEIVGVLVGLPSRTNTPSRIAAMIPASSVQPPHRAQLGHSEWAYIHQMMARQFVVTTPSRSPSRRSEIKRVKTIAAPDIRPVPISRARLREGVTNFEEGNPMSTTAIIVVVVAAIILIASAIVVTRRARASKTEGRRERAGELRGTARAHELSAEREQATADQQTARAKGAQAQAQEKAAIARSETIAANERAESAAHSEGLAVEHHEQARELDPDVGDDHEADRADTTAGR